MVFFFFFRVRIGLHWFVTRPFFDGFIMFVILLSSVALALEDPVKENTQYLLKIENKYIYFKKKGNVA